MGAEKLGRWEEKGQHDFLAMTKEEWREFVEALGEVARERPHGWQEAEAFLRLKGLYVYLDLEDLRHAAPDLFRRKRLYEIARDFAEKVGDIEVVAAVQPPTFGQDGRAHAWPPEKEKTLLAAMEKCERSEELALAVLRECGPCLLVEADDGVDYAFLAARPRAR